MRKILSVLWVALAFSAALFISCKHDTGGDDYYYDSYYGGNDYYGGSYDDDYTGGSYYSYYDVELIVDGTTYSPYVSSSSFSPSYCYNDRYSYSNKTKTGYKIKWTDESNNIVTGYVTIEKDKKYKFYGTTVPIEYTVKFDTTGYDGETLEDITCTYDTEFTIPTNDFTNGTKVACGWCTKQYYNDTNYGSYYADGANKNLTTKDGDVITLYPFFTDAIFTVTISSAHWVDENTTTREIKLPKNWTVGYKPSSSYSTSPNYILPELDDELYYFDKWTYGTSNTTLYSNPVKITADTTFTAVWKDPCTITLVTDHGGLTEAEKTVKIKYKSNIASSGYTGYYVIAYKLPALDDELYYFDKWTYGTSNTTLSRSDKIEITADTTFTAVWKNPCTITLSTEHGGLTEAEKTVQVKYNSYVALSTYTGSYTIAYKLPALDDELYYHNGWTYPKKSGSSTYTTSIYSSDRIQITEDTTFTAKWVSPVTLTFSSDYGDLKTTFGNKLDSNNKIQVKSGTYVVAPNYSGSKKNVFKLPALTSNEYTFAEWKYKEYWSSSSYTLSASTELLADEDIIFTAKWHLDYTVNISCEYVTLNPAQQSMKIPYGKTVGVASSSADYKLPAIPDTSEKTLVGWKYKKTSQADYYYSELTSPIPIEEDMTIAAVWGPINCKLTFTTSYGTAPQTVTVKNGSYVALAGYTGSQTVHKLPMLTVSGEPSDISITGWSYSGGSITSNSAVVKVTDDMVFTAIWPAIYKVTLTSDYGTLPAKSEFYVKSGAYIYPNNYTGSTSSGYKLPTLTASSYIFRGWSYNSGSSYYDVSSYGKSTYSDTTFKAKWSLPGSIDVTLPSGSSGNDVQMTYSNYTLTPTLSGFSGTYTWYVNGTQICTGASFNVLTYYAKLSSGVNSIMVTATSGGNTYSATTLVKAN